MFFYKKLAWKLHFYQVENRWVFGCERWVFMIVWIIYFVIGVIFFQNLRLSPQWSPIISWFFGNMRSFRDLNQDLNKQISRYGNYFQIIFNKIFLLCKVIQISSCNHCISTIKSFIIARNLAPNDTNSIEKLFLNVFYKQNSMFLNWI